MSKGMEVRNMSFKVGQTMTVTGVCKPEAGTFAVNIGLDAENLAIHLNPRFNWEGKRNAIVCNCYRDGTWSDEQNHECFPFQQGKEFKIVIQFTQTGFMMKLCDSSTINFPNHLGANKYTFFSFTEDAHIISIEVK
ncbi:PREDICTED: beta-galactoside-binding lectin-like [Cyprinodon variegatus]|uniref:Galectin n=1 Tax=Cyprinodon variegatus TaxID=28743 RepID=A0A3Q2CUW6_CYPVA|nr:PREDICTED: beta-galactoside-binding lectin-like [Cyprinodon variegatus]